MQRLGDLLEVQVVSCVARRAVDDRVVGHVLAVVDQDRPQVDKQEGAHEDELVHREENRIDVIRHRLSETIKRMERIRSIRARHDPLVVRLVQTLVDHGVVQPAMDPVDHKVGKHDEEEGLHPLVPAPLGNGRRVIELGEAADLEQEGRRGGDGHERHGDDGLLDFEPDLVVQELGVVEGLLVEDEDVGERGEDEVVEEAKDPA